MNDDNVKPQTMDSECLGEENATKNTAPNLLQKNGWCKSCSSIDIVGKKEVVQCYCCKNSFHAINCLNDTCVVSAPSVFKSSLYPAVNNHAPFEKRFGRFLFMCDDCLTKDEKNRAAATTDRIELLDLKFDNFKSECKVELTELKNLLKEHFLASKAIVEKEGPAPVALSTPVVPKSVSDSMLWSQRVENLKHMVTVKNKADGSILCPKVLEKTCIDSGVSAVKTFELHKSKNTGIVLNSRKDAEKLVGEIEDKLPSYDVELISAKKPEINVVGLSREYSFDELLEMIQKQNPEIAELFVEKTTLLDDKHMSVISVTKIKSYKGTQQTPYKATIRVSNLIRYLISKQGNRLFLGSQTCKVYDSFFVPRCYKCQEYGHQSKKCSQEKSTCGYCAENHETKTCNKKGDTTNTPKCINCVRFSEKSKKHIDTDHYAGFHDCPQLLVRQMEMKKRIPFHQHHR